MLKNLSLMTLFSFAATLMTFGFQTIATHLMGTEDYGSLGKWLTDIGYLGMLFVLGLDTSILYHAKKGESYEENMGKNFVIYAIVFSLAFGVVFIFGLDYKYYVPLFISIVFLAISSVFRSFFQYHEKYLWYNLLGLTMPLILLCTFFFFLFFDIKIDSDEAYMYYALVSGVAVIIAGIKYFSVSSINFSFQQIFSNFQYFFYGLKSILNKVLSLTLYASTVYCLSYFGTKEMVAYFFVASSISKMVWVLPDSAGNVLYPRFLKVGILYEQEKVKAEMFYYAQIVFFLNAIALVSFAFLGSYILKILYADSYQQAFFPILILLVGNQGMVYYKLISRYLAAQNRWKPLYLSLAIGVVTNLLFNYFLIPVYGVIGASVATSISFLLCGISMAFFVEGSLFGFLNIFTLLKKIVR